MEKENFILETFQQLGLKKPLIGLSFLSKKESLQLEEENKKGGEKANSQKIIPQHLIPHYAKKVPAGCSFWGIATDQLFYTTPADHTECNIGMYTHNFLRNKEDEKKLLEDINLMGTVDYVLPVEVADIPKLKQKKSGLIYGPWSEYIKWNSQNSSKIFSPHVAMAFSDASQGLILQEAIARVDGQNPLAMGRPACAIIPQVMQSGKAAMSFGCCGARAYVLGLGKESHLWVFHAKKLFDYAKEIKTFVEANSLLSQGHKKRKNSYDKGKTLALADTV